MNGNEVKVLPELKQIVGAMLFAAKAPLSTGDIRKVLRQVAEIWGKHTCAYAEVSEKDIEDTLRQLQADFAEKKTGVRIQEVANGYRMENEPCCGPWLRQLLTHGKPTRLSRPALETLAIIAYRQPCMRSEIEAVRGVAVDQILRNLLELQLIRIVGRSNLPGRPWLFGTTQKFLEHFGLKSLEDLPGIDELRRMEEEQMRRQEADSPARRENTAGVGGREEEIEINGTDSDETKTSAAKKDSKPEDALSEDFDEEDESSDEEIATR